VSSSVFLCLSLFFFVFLCLFPYFSYHLFLLFFSAYVSFYRFCSKYTFFLCFFICVYIVSYMSLFFRCSCTKFSKFFLSSYLFIYLVGSLITSNYLPK
jgi:hypothetical protein